MNKVPKKKVYTLSMLTRSNSLSYLVEAFSKHFNAIDFQDLVIDGQKARALSQSPGHQARDENARHPFQPLLGDPHAGAVANVKSQGLLRAMLEETNSATHFRHHINVNNSSHLLKILKWWITYKEKNNKTFMWTYT